MGFQQSQWKAALFEMLDMYLSSFHLNPWEKWLRVSLCNRQSNLMSSLIAVTGSWFAWRTRMRLHLKVCDSCSLPLCTVWKSSLMNIRRQATQYTIHCRYNQLDCQLWGNTVFIASLLLVMCRFTWHVEGHNADCRPELDSVPQHTKVIVWVLVSLRHCLYYSRMLGFCETS